MIHNHETIMLEVGTATLGTLREYQGGIEFLQANGQGKSLVSHYNATFFANLFVESNFTEPGDYFLYGVGDGQIILELLEKKIEGHIYVLETNMDILAFAHDSFKILDQLATAEHITFCGSSDIETIKPFLGLLPTGLYIRYYYPEIASIPESLSFLREWINNRMIDFNSSEKFNDLVEKNAVFNQKRGLPDFLRLFKGKFTDTPCLILLSGPSVVDALPKVQEELQNYFCISVGRNGKLCKEHGIQPHIWVDMDPQERPELWERFTENDTSVPLVIMDSASYMVHDYFKGIISIVHSKVTMEDEYALQTGKSTVAAFALELASELGLGPIILVGQDLCYLGEKSHADSGGGGVLFTDNTPKVMCNDGIERYSSKEFIRHRESLQEVVRRQSSEVYSVSEQGAQIKGVSYLPLEGITLLGSVMPIKDEIQATIQDGLGNDAV